MMKLTALNEAPDSSSDNEYANSLTREAQEQIALNEYNKALKLKNEGRPNEALNILEKLLNTELLDLVKTPAVHNDLRPVLSLKYSCLKNIAKILYESGNYHDALKNYCEAAELDDSDVMLWYKIGITAIKSFNMEIACLSFRKGLEQNLNNWPCLDNIISALYVMGDYTNCLRYIFISVDKDPSYLKALVMSQQICYDIPNFKNHFNLIDHNLSRAISINSNLDQTAALADEAHELHKQWKETFLTNINKKSFIEMTLYDYSWQELGKSFINMYANIIFNNINFSSLMKFKSLENHDDNCLNNMSFGTETLYSRSFQTDNDHDDVIHCTMVKNNKGADNDSSSIQSLLKIVEPLNDHSNIKDNGIDDTQYQIIEDNISTDECNLDSDFSNSNNYRAKGEDSFHDNKYENLEVQINLNPQKRGIPHKVKKRRRSSLCILTQWAWSDSNKRSCRTRTSNRKDYDKDGILLEDVLKQIFPSKLLPENTEVLKKQYQKTNDEWKDSTNPSHLSIQQTNVEDSTESSRSASPLKEIGTEYFGTQQESTDVLIFTQEHNCKSDVTFATIEFLKFLSIKWDFKWPDDLADIYVQLYIRTREHHFPSSLSGDSKYDLDEHNNMNLLFGELYIDKSLNTESCVSTDNTEINMITENLDEIILCDMENKYHDTSTTSYCIRSLWLKARIYLYRGDAEISSKILEMLLDYVRKLQLNDDEVSVKLRNCKNNSIISEKEIEGMLTAIKRSEKLSEIEHLIQEKKYRELSNILKETFNISKQPHDLNSSKEFSVNRVDHLEMLLHSLWQLQQYEDCYIWAEACLNESWQTYIHIANSSINEEDRARWIGIIIYSLERLEACIYEVDIYIVKYLTRMRQTRLVRNLVQIVCYQMDVPDDISIMPLENVLPWLLLHFILQYEEDKQQTEILASQKHESGRLVFGESKEDEKDIPSSIMILLKAHEFLGRRGWCCVSEGKLLTFTMKLIIPKLHFPIYSSIKYKLRESIEQIIYCLYGHPVKPNGNNRSKLKSLDEHVKNHFNFTWDTSRYLFEFYKPRNFPSFESKRVASINTETVILFKKICTMIPPDSDPTLTVEKLSAFLLGNEEEIPLVKKPFHGEISYIFYLIADFYFKNVSHQSWSNAIKYYMYDLCLHPNELNSWAGLAMSTSTLMETWLNNFHPNISEDKYLTKAKIAQQSYQRALDIAPSHLTIWTEFGNFLYTVHSFCSRLLKQESDSLNMERFRILESRKDEMLDQAKNCFSSAYQIYTASQGVDEPQDERWLYQYMLAKISEKKNEEPPIFLKHLLKASELLCRNSAQYPKRISHKNPQYLAIEALEVYYRIHAGILKYLEKNDDKPLQRSLATILENTLKRCMRSPFIIYESIFEDVPCDHINTTNKTEQSMEKVIESKKKRSENDFNDSMKIRSSIDSIQFEPYKRIHDDSIEMDIPRREELSKVSHLQLMQDVVAVIDELITKASDSVSQNVLGSAYEVYLESEKSQYSSLKIESPQGNEDSHNSISRLLEYKMSSDRKEDQNIIAVDRNFIHQKKEREKKVGATGDLKMSYKVGEILSRRYSNESTTQSSTTGTNNSTSSSSDDSISSLNSSDSTSSTESESDGIDSDRQRIRKNTTSEENVSTEAEMTRLIQYCLAGLEQCILRFPEHYKSIYRLAYFFFSNKQAKDITKCKQLLLGSYKCTYYPEQTIQGLFAERKSGNFFNGIWRIPVHEIDRPGSFSSHMSRCILLLMQVLNKAGDSRMLMELYMQLRKTPDNDKKYLRDSERQQLSHQALTLCLQCFRYRLRLINKKEQSIENYQISRRERIQILLDIYNAYQNIKNVQEYEASQLPRVKKLIEDAYLLCMMNLNSPGNVLEKAKEFCRHHLRSSKSYLEPDIDHKMDCQISRANHSESVPDNATCSSHHRKIKKVSYGARSRGRPPGVIKSSQMLNIDLLSVQTSIPSRATHTDDVFASHPHSLSNPHLLNPMLDSNKFPDMLGSSYGVDYTSSRMDYLNQFGTNQNVVQQQYSSLSTLQNIYLNRNIGIGDDIPYAQIPSNIPVRSSNLIITCDRTKPEISITPVTGRVPQSNWKSIESIRSKKIQEEFRRTYEQLPQSTKFPNELLFPPPKIGIQQYAPQVSMNTPTSIAPSHLIGSKIIDQLIHSPADSNTNVTIDETAIDSKLQPSLQQKLLLKKRDKSAKCSSSRTRNLTELHKQKQNSSTAHSKRGEAHCIYNKFPSFENYSFNNVASVSSQSMISSNKSKNPIETRTTSRTIQTVPSTFDNSIESLSVLSQLQQHSHLEIIPHLSSVKKSIDIDLLNRPTGAQNLSVRENISIHEFPRMNIDSGCQKKLQAVNQTVSEPNHVEIITLDD